MATPPTPAARRAAQRSSYARQRAKRLAAGWVPMTPAEAGHLGGTTTRDRHPDHFARIAKLGAAKGGQTTRDRHGSAHYSRIAKLARAGDAGRRKESATS